jgi:hypothetical protein
MSHGKTLATPLPVFNSKSTNKFAHFISPSTPIISKLLPQVFSKSTSFEKHKMCHQQLL